MSILLDNMHDSARISTAILQFAQMPEPEQRIVLERSRDVAEAEFLSWDKNDKLLKSLGMEHVNLHWTVKLASRREGE